MMVLEHCLSEVICPTSSVFYRKLTVSVFCQQELTADISIVRRKTGYILGWSSAQRCDPYMQCESGAVAALKWHGISDGKNQLHIEMWKLCAAVAWSFDCCGAIRKLRTAIACCCHTVRKESGLCWPVFDITAVASPSQPCHRYRFVASKS